MESIETLNQRLTDTYGKDFLNRPRFRIVHSETQFEKRLGTYTDYLGDIFLREVTEVRLVKKYGFVKGKFILEMVSPKVDSTVKNHNGYEALFVFQTDKGDYLEPIWRAIEYIIYMVQLPISKDSPNTLAENEAKDIEAERQFILDYMSRPFDGALSFGEAVTVPEMKNE